MSRQCSDNDAANESPTRQGRLPQRTPTIRPTGVPSTSRGATQTDSAPQTDPNDAIDCPICMETIPAARALASCGHVMCQPCLRRYVRDRVAAREVPVTCPIPECRAPLEEAELQLFLNEEEMRAVAEASAALLLGPRAMHCPYANCGVLVEGMERDSVALGAEHCPHCTQPLCPACRVPWHRGQTCLEYRRGEEGPTAEGRALTALTALAAEREWQLCPACNHLVEKIGGCNHMHCRCGADFCYRCGGSYGANHGNCTARAGLREVAPSVPEAAARPAVAEGQQVHADDEHVLYDDDDDD